MCRILSQHLRDLTQFGNAVDAKLSTSMQPSVRQRIFSYFHYFFYLHLQEMNFSIYGIFNI